MKPVKAPPPADTGGEISALIATLHKTGQRLEELTAGEIDSVTDADGGAFLLRRAQEELRHTEAAKQAAILNALPAHIALLDPGGLILSVNEAWRRSARTNVTQAPGHEVGRNYVDICDGARRDGAFEAHKVADGIRSVLAGRSMRYSFEYPCHSAGEQRWLLMTVTPLSGQRQIGAVVMHMDVTAERQAKENQRVSESRFRQMAENIRDVFFLVDKESYRMLYISPAYEEIWGRSCESAYANPQSLSEAVHPDDRAAAFENFKAGMTAGTFEYQYRIVRPDGAIRWIETRGFPVRDEDGSFKLVTGVAEDITERKHAERELHDSELLFRQMAESINDVFFLQNLDSTHVYYVSPAYEQVWGHTCKSLYDNPGSWAESIHPGDRDRASQEFRRGRTSGFDYEFRIIRPGGEIRWIHVRGFPILDDTGTPYRTAGVASDVTERKQDEIRIKRLIRMYAVLSGINTLIVRVRDRDELFWDACRIAVAEGGFRMALIGILNRKTMKVEPVASAGKDEELMAAIRDALSPGEGAPDTMIAQAMRDKKAVISNDSQNDPKVLFGASYAKSGVRSMVIVPLIVAEEAIGVLALYSGEIDFFHEEELQMLSELASDIGFAVDHIDKQERLDYLAYYDVLTGLANRSLFHNRLSNSLHTRGGEQPLIATIMLDLERFRQVNETLGRDSGDELLRDVGARLYRANDTAARLGVDIFGLTLRGTRTAAEVNRALEAIIAACFTEPFVVRGQEVRVSCRAGVAVFPDDGADADALLRNAEAALRRSRRSGDRIVFYAPEMNARVAETLAIETSLRRAVARREFVLHYQPKVDLASGRIIGVEALIRWEDPDKGLIPPGEFIPVLEETGMIVEVGRWVVEQVFIDVQAWESRGICPRRVAVNVSAIQLRGKDFVDTMVEEIRRGGNHPEWLELEITESVVMSNVEDSTRKLSMLRDMGVTVAIDDFGTGYSSLSYLSHLPVDSLKIDQSFVSGMTDSEGSASIASTIIALAHGLKLKVVAEGVETRAQGEILRRLGCDEAQGFFYSRPIPAAGMEILLREDGTLTACTD